MDSWIHGHIYKLSSFLVSVIFFISLTAPNLYRCYSGVAKIRHAVRTLQWCLFISVYNKLYLLFYFMMKTLLPMTDGHDVALVWAGGTLTEWIGNMNTSAVIFYSRKSLAMSKRVSAWLRWPCVKTSLTVIWWFACCFWDFLETGHGFYLQ